MHNNYIPIIGLLCHAIWMIVVYLFNQVFYHSKISQYNLLSNTEASCLWRLFRRQVEYVLVVSFRILNLISYSIQLKIKCPILLLESLKRLKFNFMLPFMKPDIVPFSFIGNSMKFTLISKTSANTYICICKK